MNARELIQKLLELENIDVEVHIYDFEGWRDDLTRPVEKIILDRNTVVLS